MIYLWPLYYYEVGCWLVWSGAYSLTGAKILVNSSLKKGLCLPYMQLLFLLGGCTTPLFPTQAVFVGVGCQQRLSLAFLFVLRLPCDHCSVTQDRSHFVGGLWRELPRQAELLLFYTVLIAWRNQGTKGPIRNNNNPILADLRLAIFSYCCCTTKLSVAGPSWWHGQIYHLKCIITLTKTRG